MFCFLNFSSLQSLLEYDEDDFESLFPFRFEITRDVFGEFRTEPLKPNGSEIPVNKENRYVMFIILDKKRLLIYLCFDKKILFTCYY